MMDWDKTLNLRLFAEGGGEGGGQGAGAGEATGAEAEDAAPQYPARRTRKNELQGVKYGVQPEAPDVAGQETQEQQSQRRPWAEVVKDYQEDHDKEISAIVQKRLKNVKGSEEALKALGPVLENLADRLGMDRATLATTEGLKALADKYTGDDREYEEEAMKRGMDVSTLKQVKQLERQQREIEAYQAQRAEEERNQQHFVKLVQQSEAAKQVYPNLDLRAELQNADFVRLTSPQVGVDVKTAYEVVHRDEINSSLMGYAAQRARDSLAQTMASGKRRPSENGTGKGAPVDVRSDPSKFDKKDFAENLRRAQMGEKIAY